MLILQRTSCCHPAALPTSADVLTWSSLWTVKNPHIRNEQVTGYPHEPVTRKLYKSLYSNVLCLATSKQLALLTGVKRYLNG